MEQGEEQNVATPTEFQQIGSELQDLIMRGVPPSLQQRTTARVDVGQEGDKVFGGAFEGDDAEPSFLDGVSTAIPSVEVRCGMYP